MKILIIGGGAAGLAAAVCARRENKTAEITVLERQERVAKKLLATGNGRCNFTNSTVNPSCYFGSESFISDVLTSFGTAEAVEFFNSLGVKHREEDGRIYPLSNRASSVADALRLFLDENDVKIITGVRVKSLVFQNGAFFADGTEADRVIASFGGRAAPAFGTAGDSYSLLENFGHRRTPLRPALVSVKTDTEKIKGLKGVKVFARAALLKGGRRLAHSGGEVLFTDYGLSGIPIMQLSRFAEAGAEISLDMLPGFTFGEVCGEIKKRIALFPRREGGELFSGLLDKRLAVPALRYAGVEKTTVKAEALTEENVRKIAEYFKNLRLNVKGTSGFDSAQVTAGGIETAGFDSATMESKKRRGLYAAGEVLDCDGLCGGYNLHWAWATGCIAGYSAAKGD